MNTTAGPDIQLLDLALSAFILLFIIAPRFNSWTHNVQHMFSGRPSEYIDKYRYLFYLASYLSTYIILAIALHNFPQLLQIIDVADAFTDWQTQVGNIVGQGSFTFNFLVLTMLLINPAINIA